MAPIIPMAHVGSQKNIEKEREREQDDFIQASVAWTVFTPPCPPIIYLYLSSQTSSRLSLWSPISTSDLFFFLKKNERDLTFWLFRILILYFTFASELDLAFVITMLVWSGLWFSTVFILLNFLFFSLSMECPNCVTHIQAVHILNASIILL